MVTVIVNFKFPAGSTLETARTMFSETAPRYQEVAGLIRKHYLFDPDTEIGGGAYLFEDMKSAKAFAGDDYVAFVTERYSAPTLNFFHTPVIVDNEAGRISTA